MYAIKTEKLTKKYKEKTAVSNLTLKSIRGESDTVCSESTVQEKQQQ